MRNLINILKRIDKKKFVEIGLVVVSILIAASVATGGLKLINNNTTKDKTETKISNQTSVKEDEEELFTQNKNANIGELEEDSSSVVTDEGFCDVKEENVKKSNDLTNDANTLITSTKQSLLNNGTSDKADETNKIENKNVSENIENVENAENTEDAEKGEIKQETAIHTVEVYSAGGYSLYNIKVDIYADSTKAELLMSAYTNSKGKVTLNLVPSKEYAIALSNVPEGYQVETTYKFSQKLSLIILKSSIITGKDFPTTKLKVGHVMYDFSVSNASGNKLTLSEILKNKKMVMLNFWYVNCEFCVKEFPMMSSAYKKFEDDIEIIALTPFDTMDVTKTFLDSNPLPFQVATCSSSLPNVFGVQAYPVSVVIDRYGVIREIENGAILEEQGFIDIFKKYTY